MAYLTKALFRNSFENRGKETEKIRLVAKRLQSMKEQQGSVQRELQAYLENKIDTAVHELSSYLKSPKVKEEFTSWTSDDVPVHEDSWAVTDDSIKKTLRKRLGYVIRTWEEESHVFADSRTSLVKHFQQRFNLVEHQLQIIESAVTTDNESGTRSNLPQVGPDNWDLARRIVIGVTSPIWAPLGLVALTLSLPLIGVISFKETFYDLLKQVQYEKNKVKFMKVSSEEHLSSAANENYLRSYVREEVKESQAYLSQVVHLIPQLIEADEMLCQKLRNGSRLHKEKEKLYESLYQRSLCLQERAASFGIQEVGIIDINCDDLEWIAEKGSFLGTTAWATVFKGKLKRQKPVALKIWKDEINGPVTSSFLAQIQTLRYIFDLMMYNNSPQVASLPYFLFSQKPKLPCKTKPPKLTIKVKNGGRTS